MLKKGTDSDYIFELPEEETVSLQITSDVHLELLKTDEIAKKEISKLVTPSAKYLALLGDIGDPEDPIYAYFLNYLSELFEYVFVVPGSNCPGSEYKSRAFCLLILIQRLVKYPITYQSGKKLLEKICQSIEKSNVILLMEQTIKFQLKNKIVWVLGTTLWSNIPKKAETSVSSTLKDYKYIYQSEDEIFTVNFAQNLYEESNKWLRNEIKRIEELENDDQIVVLTHHVPSFYQTSHPQFEGMLSKHGFVTDMEDLFLESKNNNKVKLWACGHTHFNFDHIIRGTRVISNQRGYLHDKIGYRPDFTIDF
ncbi:ser/thr protein phosphatase superfamily [Anaeramoeba flamelloides]|uniref:Ser/thr protein phosphatase superfamily n=1 Tax=Anaeramoeba flamelloides TaxID=1746091 RepID=A0AAV7YPI1_9EUKA|nr:ser/thr protein phosphatase superfamily [Anaeramoeba flamelloides]